MQRRLFLAAPTALLWGGGCGLSATSTAHIQGGFVGTHPERGHALRDTPAWSTPQQQRTVDVVVAGAGVAGLAAARALLQRGVQDLVVLDMEDAGGGNARAGSMGGMACPLGAHYLPVPGNDAPRVQQVLEDWGLLRRVAGRWVADERHLCHSPQERLFFQGEWQPGLLPVQGVGAATRAQYQRFAVLVADWRRRERWRMPCVLSAWTPQQAALQRLHFSTYLDQHGLDDGHLRWYLDYCCRDDFGAGLTQVSAWAGLHYFASRHGFAAPDTEPLHEAGVFTWPQGNAWLTQRLAQPLGTRLHTAQLVVRAAQVKHGVEVDVWDVRAQQLVRWRARQLVLALPLMVAARVLQGAPDWLLARAQRTVYAPWAVANLQLKAALRDRPGAPLSWDNVLYGSAGLGYVNAQHQSLQPVPGPTVLTYYRPLGDVGGSVRAGRRFLRDTTWAQWRDSVVAELSVPHPDLAAKVERLDVTRYGHAMAVPVPMAEPPPRGLVALDRVHFAHSDWAGYSVFEEAYTMGYETGHQMRL